MGIWGAFFRGEWSGQKLPAGLVSTTGIITALFSVGLFSAVFLQYRDQAGLARRNTFADLTAITDFKSRELARWVGERKSNLALTAGEPRMQSACRAVLEGGAEAVPTEAVAKQLGMASRIAGFSSLCLVRPDGTHLISAGLKCPHKRPDLGRALKGALGGRGPVLIDFHRAESGPIHLDFICPVSAGDGGGRPLGALVGVVYPDDYLYSFIQNWPLPSKSAEILLVNRQGEEVVFLNELRFKAGSALALHLPVSKNDLPAAVAARGGRGVIEGTDYRGERVLATYDDVPGTPWHLVAKIDHSEVLEPVNHIMRFWIGALLLLLAAGLVALAMLWRRSLQESLSRGHAAEREREMLAVRLDFLSRYTNDILLVADGQYKILDANDRAVQAYGWSRRELIGMSARDLRAPESADKLERDLLGPSGGLYETMARRKDGTIFPVEVNYSRFELRGRVYVAAIIRDVTDRQNAEAALRNSEARFRSLFDNMNEGVALHELVRDRAGLVVNYRIMEVNNRYSQILGLNREEVLGRLATEVYGSVEPPFLDAFTRPALTSVPADLELYFEPLRRHFHVSVAPWGPEGFATIFTDITSRKKTETALLESERRFRGAMETARALAIQLDREGRVTFANDSLLKLLGWPQNEVVGADWGDKFVPAGARERLRDIFVEAIKSGRLTESVPNPVEGVINVKSGEIRTIRWSFSLNTHSDGTVLGVSGFGEDITERKRAEEALALSLSLLDSSLEATADGILVVDLQGKVSKYNRKFAEMWRIPADLLKQGFDESLLAFVVSQLADPELFLSRVNYLYAHPDESSVDEILLTEGRVFERHSHPQRINGGVVGRVWSFRDVTPARKTLESLRLSEETARALMDATPDISLIIDKNGNFASLNQATARRFGKPPEELVGTSAFDVNPPEVRDNRRRIVESVFSSGQPEVFEDEFSGKTMENRIFPVKNARGHVDMVAVFSRDMTERRRAEQAVRESEERFRRIFEESSVGIAIVSLEGRFIRTNPAFQNIIGYSDTELLQMKFLDITHPDHRDQDAQEVARLARGELQRYVTNKRYVRKDGSRMWAHVTVSVVRDPAGKPMYFIPLVDDITNLHKAEQEMVRLDKLESLSVLAGGLAHDFNNLLTAIMGNISLVQSDPSTGEKSTQRLRSAEAASLRARDLTQQLLTFSRGGTPDRKPVCLRSTVIESAEFATHGSRVRCEFRLPDDMWSVEADSGQISQVFSNLVINGVHAMPDGGVIEIGAKNEVVTVDTRPALAPGRYLHLWVRDSGVGIPPEHLAKIYDPYFTTKQNGVGLGLATAYSIIRHHAGILEAESAPGAGTTFHILIPALPEGTALPGEDAQEIVHGKGRILLMDDEESVREIGAGMLQSLGYGVETVPEGRLALSAYKKAMDSGTPFSAVILDLTIPAGMGGLETLAKLRELDPHARVVVSSGYSGDMVLGDYRARGFNEVLAKPYRLKDMSALLGRLLA